MSYEVIALACEKLSYRDKLRLAQLLIQAARKEEEQENPQKRINQQEDKKNLKTQKNISQEVSIIDYAIERISKLKPTKKKSLLNSIKSMFQFQGGISESDMEKVVSELQKRKLIKLENNKVHYL